MLFTSVKLLFDSHISPVAARELMRRCRGLLHVIR